MYRTIVINYFNFINAFNFMEATRMITDFTQGTLTLTLRRAGGETWTRRMEASELPEDFVASPGDPAALRGSLRDLERVPGQRIRWEIRAMEPCELLEASWAGTAELSRDTRVFMNGWQSWTDGEEQDLSGRTPSLGPLIPFQFLRRLLLYPSVPQKGGIPRLDLGLPEGKPHDPPRLPGGPRVLHLISPGRPSRGRPLPPDDFAGRGGRPPGSPP